jgi:hypothetical protein
MRRLPIALFVSAAVLLAGCGGSKSSPAAPSAPAVTSLTVTGTATLTSKGQTAPLTATVTLSNGTTQIVTGQATWQSSNIIVATVSSGGLVTSAGDGEATITASYQGISGTMRVTVTLPRKAVPEATLVLRAYLASGKYRSESNFTFKETGGVFGFTFLSFRIDYYNQAGTFLIAQTWNTLNIGLALGSGGRIAPGATKDWQVNWLFDPPLSQVRADFSASYVDDVGTTGNLQGSQTVTMPTTVVASSGIWLLELPPLSERTLITLKRPGVER